jgi:hypothetical protein
VSIPTLTPMRATLAASSGALQMEAALVRAWGLTPNVHAAESMAGAPDPCAFGV